jgi:hypothetical protein
VQRWDEVHVGDEHVVARLIQQGLCNGAGTKIADCNSLGDVGVISINDGSPKWMVYNGKSYPQ